MPRWVSILVQSVGMIAQVVNVELFPKDYRIMIMTGIAVIQGITGIIAHSYNPDGTNASCAYVPKCEPKKE